MEPIHIHALLHRKVDAETRREQLEQHFAVRAEARRKWRVRLRRRRLFVIGRRAPAPTVRPAV